MGSVPEKKTAAPWQMQLEAWLAEGVLPRRKSDPRYWREQTLRHQKAHATVPLLHATPPVSKPLPSGTSSSPAPSPSPLSPADRRLWQQWLRETAIQPLSQSDRIWLERPLPPPRPRQREEDEAAIRTELLAPLTLEDWLEHDSDTQFLRPGVPRRVLAEMRRGRWTIRRQLDLHGLTRDAAREAIGRFLQEALAAGERCVRIVHGKGLGSPGGVSVLKHLSRQWLSRREEILAFCEAAPNQGGSGALLVLLRAPHAGS